MSDANSLQIITEAALKRIGEKQTEHVSSLRLAEEDLNKHASAILSGTMDSMSAICEGTLTEASSLKKLTEETLAKSYQLLDGDLDSTAARAIADVNLKLGLTKQGLERLRETYDEVVIEYQSVQAEVIELTRDGAVAALLQASPQLRTILAGQKNVAPDELVEVLSNLLETEKQIALRVGDKLIAMLGGWQSELEAELKVIRESIDFNHQLGFVLEQTVKEAAESRSQSVLAQIDQRVQALQEELEEGFERIKETTGNLMLDCTKRTAEEIEKVIALANARRTRGEEKVKSAQDENRQLLKQFVETHEVDALERLSLLLGTTTGETERLSERFVGLQHRAISEQKEALNDLLEQLTRATREFEAQLATINERGVKQLSTVMDEGDTALNNLSTAVVEKFRKSNKDYVLVLDNSHKEIENKLQETKSSCLSLIENLSNSLIQTESHSE